MTTTPNIGLTYLVAGQLQPEVPVNEAWNILDALAGSVAQFGNKSSATIGLTYGYYGGRVYSNGANITIADGTLTLAASATNYVQRTAAGVVSVNSTGFTAGLIPMATVVTGASTITTITDARAASSDLRGRQVIAVAATNITLTDAQVNARILSFQGALTANVVVTLPAYQQEWIVSNESTGAFTLQVQTAGGLAQTVPQGIAAPFYGNGSNIVPAVPLWTNGFKNYLINGDFEINQRVFAGGALAAGVYGFDRWKAGTGGCNISLSAGVLTHTSGPLVQVIEAPNLAGETITVSVDGLSGGNLDVNVEGVTGVIAASASRAGVTLAVPSTSTGNVTVTLTPASGAVTYKRVQVELGSVATAFEWRPNQVEIALCQRYGENIYIGLTNGLVSAAGQVFGAGYVFKTEKRGVPAFSLVADDSLAFPAGLPSITPVSTYGLLAYKMSTAASTNAHFYESIFADAEL